MLFRSAAAPPAPIAATNFSAAAAIARRTFFPASFATFAVLIAVSRSTCPLRMTVAARLGAAADALHGKAFPADVADLIFAFGAVLIFCFFTKVGRACFWTRTGFAGTAFLLVGTGAVSFANDS